MPNTLTPEQMKLFVRRHFEDFVNNRKPHVIRDNMTPDFYDHDGPGGKPTDRNGDEAMMIKVLKALPDFRVTVEDMVAEGDKVVCRNVWHWTARWTGKKMEQRGFVLWRFSDDKIAERWAALSAPTADKQYPSGQGRLVRNLFSSLM